MNNTPLEEEEQRTFVDWLEIKGLKFTAIPNSTYTKSWNQKRKNHAMGLRPGLPDMIVITSEGLLFIEMKRKKGSVISPEQKEWLNALDYCRGVATKVCYGADEAIGFVTGYL